MTTTGSAASALEYIDTAIGLATVLMSDRLAATEENIEACLRREESGPPPEFSPDEAQAFVALLVIEPDLLYDLTTLVHKAKDTHNLCMEKAALAHEWEDCARQTGRSICEILNHIRNRNEGKLPTGALTDQWESFGCRQS